MACLTSKYTGNKDAWGCLSEDNLLFRINSLSYIRIPDWVVNHLVKEKVIWLKKDAMSKGYYECAKPAPVRKRISFEEPVIEEEIIVEPAKQVTTERVSVMALLKRPNVSEEAKQQKSRRISF